MSLKRKFKKQKARENQKTIPKKTQLNPVSEYVPKSLPNNPINTIPHKPSPSAQPKYSPLAYLDAKDADSKVKKLILSGLLASLSFILFSLTMVPIAQFIAIVVAPIPMTYISLKYGFKHGILCSLTASTLVSMLMGPVQGYFFISLFAVVGLATGIIARKKIKPMQILIVGTLVMVLFNLLFYYGVERVLGLQDFIAEAKVSTIQALSWSTEKYVEIIKPSEQEAKKIYMYTKEAAYNMYIWLKMPLFLFIIASFATFYLNYLISSIFFNKLKIPGLEPLPPFFLWKAPKSLGIFFICLFLATIFMNPAPSLNDKIISSGLIKFINPANSNICFKMMINEYAWKMHHPDPGNIFLLLINLRLCLDFSFYFLGLSLISFWLFTKKFGFFARLFTMIISFPLFRIFTLIGLVDSFQDIRKELVEKLKNRQNT